MAQGSNTPVSTNASGIAAQTLVVGPLAEGRSSGATACLNGTGQCVTFNAFGSRPEYATVQAVSGTYQTIGVSDTPSPIVLRVFDMDGNAMAGGTVTLYQAIYAWAPACPPQGRCAQPELLRTQTASGTTGLDGSVMFTPAVLPGVATETMGIAATGNTGTESVIIERHP
jgi:hypothetical protein